jgi:hypothetical protein
MTIPKIRAWDPELCLMVPDHCLTKHESGKIYAVCSPVTGRKLVIAHEIDPQYIMQSFHVVDKSLNGVEIYEGDIVEFEDYNSDYEDTFMNFGIVELADLGLNITNRFEVELEDLLLGNNQLDVRVVGNIYENKDLLEEI